MRALALLRATRAIAVAGAVLATITCTNPDSPTAVGTSELQGGDGTTPSAVALDTIAVTLGSSRIDVGGRTKAIAILLDAAGNVITGRSVRWLSSDASVASVGLISGNVRGLRNGTAAIVAVLDGVKGSATLTVGPVVAPPPPPPPHPAPVASVTVTLGDSVIDVGETTTARAILRDSSNNILTGRTITGSSSNPLVATVDTATGIVVGVAPGTSDLVAVSEGVTGRATITVRPPPPPPATAVAIVTQPGGAMSGAALAPQPVAQIRDANGNVVTSWNEPVTASIASGTGVLSGTLAATAVNGVATFANLVITGSGAHTLRITSGMLAPATSGSFDVSAPPPPPPAAMGCANPQPGWIWCDDFETDQLARYFEVATAGGSLARTSGVGRNGSYAIRSRFAPGQVNAGSLKLAFGRTPSSYFRPIDAGTRDYRDVYWRVYLRNAPGWTGGGDKFARATVLASSNWAQAMIAHVWSGTGSQLLIEPASGTDVTGNVRTTKYNDFANLRWLGSARGATPILDAAHANQWYCIESHVRLNTTGQSDGVFEYWIDSQLEARLTGLNWLGAYSAYGLNAIFLENYWNSGSPVAQERYFDDLVVSENPIGCLAATPPPPLPPPPPPPSDTREPTNFVLITQRDFGAKIENGWLDRGDAAFSIQPDASAPRADKSVGQALFPAGYAAGSGPINTYYNISGSKTKLYVQLWLRISSNWQGQQAGINKVLFFWVAGGPSIYLNLQGSGTSPLVFRVNTQFPSAIQTKDFSLGQGRFGGRDIEAVRDRWYQWELLLETNSASGVADGRIQSWIDGVKFVDSNVEVPAQDAFPGLIMWETGRSPYFSQVSWNPTWGGVGGTVISDMTQRIDYIRVSGLP
jgi:hypothetical protein